MSARSVPASQAGAPARDPNLRPLAQGAWVLYDFANTIFSFAIVSGAIGLWLVWPVSDRWVGSGEMSASGRYSPTGDHSAAPPRSPPNPTSLDDRR